MTYYKISHALSWHVVLAATALLCFSCHVNPQSRHRAELDHIDSVILQAPDSALALLNRMSEETKGWQKSDRMHYDLLTIKVTDKANIPLNSDSAINKIVAYYEDHTDDYLLANAYYYAGRTYVQENDALLALDYFNKAFELVSKDSINPLNDCILSQKGYIYRNQGFFLKEREMHREVLKYAIHAKDTVGCVYAIRDIGGTYESQENYDSCNWYLHAALKLAEKFGNEELTTNVKFSLTDNYKYLNRYDSAKYYLQHILENVSPSSQSPAFCNATEIYEHYHQDDSARYYANRVLQIGNAYGKLCAYRNLTRMDLRRHDVEGAKRNFEQYVAYVDSANRLRSEEALANAMSLYDYSGYVTLSEKAQSDKDKALMWMAIAILAFLVAASCTAYLYAMMQRKRKNMNLKKHLLEPDTSKPDIKVLLRQLLENKEHLSQDQRRGLFEYMEATDPGFMVKLNALGKFSNNEKLVFVLRKMGYIPSEIAILAGIAMQTVSSIRSRAYEKITKEKGSSENMDDLIWKL